MKRLVIALRRDNIFNTVTFMERVNILKPLDLILNLWLYEAFEEEEKDID